jgi:hypothetical protein
MAEARMVHSKLSVVGVIGPCVLPLSEFRPFRTLLSAVSPTVEWVVFSESTHAFPPRRSNPGGIPHFGRPLDAHRTQTPLRQIEQRMPLPPKQLDPADFRLPEFFEAFYPIKFVSDDVIAIMHSKPIVEWSLSPRPSNFDMLPQANFDGFSRKAYIAIDELRPEPEAINHASGRKFGSHEISAVSDQSSQHAADAVFHLGALQCHLA